MPNSLFIRLVAVAVLLTLVGYRHPIPTISGINSWGGSDFAYHFGALEAHWAGVIPEPYSFESLKTMMEWKFGVVTEVVMPIGYSPTMIWLLKPVYVLSPWIAPEYAWNLLSLSLLSLMLLSPGMLRFNGFHLLALGSLLSNASMNNLQVAQSSFLGAALFLLLATESKTKFHVLCQALALVALSMKPNYFFMGTLLAIFANNRRPVLYAAFPVAVLLFAGFLTLPLSAWGAWATNMAFHTSGTDPRFLTDGIAAVFDRTLTLRTIISALTTPELGWAASGFIFNVLLGLWVGLGMWVYFRNPSWTSSQRSWVQAGLIGTVLVFSPYVGFYEEVLWVPILILLSRTQETISIPMLCAAALALLPGWVGPHPAVWLTAGKLIAAIGLRLLPFRLTPLS